MSTVCFLLAAALKRLSFGRVFENTAEGMDVLPCYRYENDARRITVDHQPDARPRGNTELGPERGGDFNSSLVANGNLRK